jgi:putative addiction module killer protein
MWEVLHYLDAQGHDVFQTWFEALRDREARKRILQRVTRLGIGQFGDCKPLREGVWELRIDAGAGYRVYYARSGQTVILLLFGGDKRTQEADIERAIGYWQDWQRRTSDE